MHEGMKGGLPSSSNRGPEFRTSRTETYQKGRFQSTTMESSCAATSDVYMDSMKCSGTCTVSQSSEDDYALSGDYGAGGAKGRNAKPRWLKSVKNWLSVSEPSAQALKHQKLSTYQRHGIDLKDPQAAAKMHLPIGRVPSGVTTSTTGPAPEKALVERARHVAEKQHYLRHGGSHSISSGMSSNASTKSTREAKKIAPWV